jgi:thymidylate synthase ThyX
MPPSVISTEQEMMFESAMLVSWQEYRMLREGGCRPEDARYVLPNACLTKLKASANFNNWRKFFELRSDQTAQWEIRMVSNAVLSLANKLAPQVFGDLAKRYLTEDALIADIVDRSQFDNYNNWVES